MAGNPIRLRIPRGATFPTLAPGASFDVYAQAYYDSAEIIYKKLWKGPKHVPSPDWVVWPVLFLLHHFMELEFKEIIHLCWSIGQELKVELKPYPDNEHNLDQLMQVAESNLQHLAPNLDGLDLDAHPLLRTGQRELMEDLQNFTDGGVNVRYPVQRRNQGGGPTLPEGYVADIPAVMKGIEEIKNQFSGVIGYLSDIDQTLFEAHLEQQRQRPT